MPKLTVVFELNDIETFEESNDGEVIKNFVDGLGETTHESFKGEEFIGRVSLGKVTEYAIES